MTGNPLPRCSHVLVLLVDAHTCISTMRAVVPSTACLRFVFRYRLPASAPHLSYMQALLADAQAHGALLALHTRMVGAELGPAPVHVCSGEGATRSNSGSSEVDSAKSVHARAGVPVKVLHLETIAAAGGSAPGDGKEAATGAGGDGGAAGGGSSSSSTRGLGCGPERWSAPAAERSVLRARWVVNAAGLHARRVAASVAGVPPGSVPKVWLAKVRAWRAEGGAQCA